MRKIIKLLNSKKNKKGFSLVELLVSIAILAVCIPFLLNGFFHAADLNLRSKFQQRVDEAAVEVFEGVASVPYSELAQYFSEENGWESLGTRNGELYKVTKKHYSSDECTVTVTVSPTSEEYNLPDLNFLGVHSKYISLFSQINKHDNVAANRVEQAIKNDTELKLKIAEDIAVQLGISYIDVDESKILVTFDPIDETKISKETVIDLKTEGDDFVAEYTTSYRYPALRPNPLADSERLSVNYSYSYRQNGEWKVLNKTGYKYNGVFYSDSVTGFEKVAKVSGENRIFVYYNPLTKYDWIRINSDTTDSSVYGVYFIEQGAENAGHILNLGASVGEVNNNFFYTTTVESGIYARKVIANDSNQYTLYSNIPSIAQGGIPDSVYTDGEKTSWLYKVSVDVEYKTDYFANVTGTFNK